MRKTKNDQGKTDYIADPASTEVLCARFYDLKTAKPIFAGADDGIVYSTFQEMAAKNKVAYDFFSTRPAELRDIKYDQTAANHNISDIACCMHKPSKLALCCTNR
ncbi:MAG: hypothetical protein IPK32_16295 [Verrucomicrobiaceae bacterium]|nr:hypothetical protein [Verrucomicrobiaceae bacterium]